MRKFIQMFYIMPIVLTYLACNSGNIRVDFPSGINTYSETVIVPGISQRDLLLKLALYKANSRIDFDYTATDEQYKATFRASGLSDKEREMMYSYASELRKAVYSIPFNDETELLESGHCSNELYYRIAIANPQFKQAVINYAECIEHDSPNEVITILDFVRDDDTAQEIIARIKDRQEEERAQRQAEAEEARRRWEEGAAERAEAARLRAEYEEQQRQENYDNLMNSISNLGNVMSKNKQGNQNNAYSNTGTNTYNSGNTGNTSNQSSRHESSSRNNFKCSERGGARDKYSWAESSARSAYNRMDGGSMAGYAKSDKEKAQRDMRSIRNEASRNGCKIDMSVWENK